MTAPAVQRAVAADNGAGDSDTVLAARIAAGDTRAFEQVMRRHNRMLYRMARSILQDDAEAEDCLQSAYLCAYRAIAGFGGRARLSTWLARIVINEALGRKRRTARRGAVIPFDGVAILDLPQAATSGTGGGDEGPEREAMRRELAGLIEHQIDALPEAFRGVFVLRAIEEMSVDETADLLDIPAATVRTRYFRARGLLREGLAQQIDVALDEAFAFAGARCDRIVAAVLAQLGDLPPSSTG